MSTPPDPLAHADPFGIVGSVQAGAFQVERVVAEGGQSVVYRARHTAFRAPVALKCLKLPGDISDGERRVWLERFREEGELLFRLSVVIPEIVRPLHVDTLALPDGRFVPFLALEWLDGDSLDGLVQQRLTTGQAPMSPFKLTKLLTPVARALARAHRFPGPAGTLSVVHRDVKPQNVLVARIGDLTAVKLLDFGIARVRSAVAESRGLTDADLVEEGGVLTPRYAAPEQWDPARLGPSGSWTDVWGLALTMVEVMAARPALEGGRDELFEQVVESRDRPTPRSRGVVLPDETEAAFRKALAAAPKERTRHVEAFWTELETSLGMPPSFTRRDQRRDSATQGIPLPRRTIPPHSKGDKG